MQKWSWLKQWFIPDWFWMCNELMGIPQCVSVSVTGWRDDANATGQSWHSPVQTHPSHPIILTPQPARLLFLFFTEGHTHPHTHTPVFHTWGLHYLMQCSILSHLQIRSLLPLLTIQEPIHIYHCKSNLPSVKYICFVWSIPPDQFFPEIKTISAKTTWPKSQEAIEPESIAAWSPN